jgi:hypothetical protein
VASPSTRLPPGFALPTRKGTPPSSSQARSTTFGNSSKFNDYYVYLKGVGFVLELAPPTFSVDENKNDLEAYYDPAKNEIVVSAALAETDAALREFTHHVLRSLQPDAFQRRDSSGLESGLADYFPASFLNDSDYMRQILLVFQGQYPGISGSSRSLENHRSFTELQIGRTEEHDAGNVWAGAFWELRQTLGQPTFDKLLLAAWKNVDVAKTAADLKAFPAELLAQDRAAQGGRDESRIREVFRRRGLKL